MHVVFRGAVYTNRLHATLVGEGKEKGNRDCQVRDLFFHSSPF